MNLLAGRYKVVIRERVYDVDDKKKGYRLPSLRPASYRWKYLGDVKARRASVSPRDLKNGGLITDLVFHLFILRLSQTLIIQVILIPTYSFIA